MVSTPRLSIGRYGRWQIAGRLMTDAHGYRAVYNFLRAIFAGWLIALTVWMLPAVASRLAIIILLTYLIAWGVRQSRHCRAAYYDIEQEHGSLLAIV